MNNIDFTITGQCPSGKNSVIVPRTGKRFPNKRFCEWRAHAFQEMKAQSVPVLQLDTPINVTIKYYAGDNRRRDVPGIIDALWHVIERYGVVKDDKHLGGILCSTLFEHWGKQDNPRLDVSLTWGNNEILI